MNTVNRLEFNIGSSTFWSNNIIKMTIYSDEKRAGLVNLSVSPVDNANMGSSNQFALDVWETAAEVL